MITRIEKNTIKKGNVLYTGIFSPASSGTKQQISDVVLDDGYLKTSINDSSNFNDVKVKNSDFAGNVSNPNLLINGDFRVNQRGGSTYTQLGYTVDRWRIDGGTPVVVTPNTDGGIRINNTSSSNLYFIQYIENYNMLAGKIVSYSVKVNGTVYSNTFTMPSPFVANTGYGNIFTPFGVIYFYYYSDGKLGFTVQVNAGQNIYIDYAKLEIGSAATQFSPRPYAEELVMCQRYYNSVFVNGCSQIYQGSIYFTKDLPTTMRVSPSLTMIDECYTYTYDGNYIGVGTVTINSMRGSSISLKVTNSAFTNNVVISTGIFSIKLDAEIY